MVNAPTPMSPNTNGDPQSTEKLKQSAGYIGGVIALALAGYFGWTYFQGSNANVDTVAADKYVAIERDAIALVGNEDDTEALKKIEADIDALVAQHGSTIYAWQALMTKARIASDNNDFETAKQALDTALNIELDDTGLQAMTTLRYAAILLANGELDEAKTQASNDVPLPFEGSQQELLGDIYLAQNDEEGAIRSYQNAWDLLSNRSEERGILRLKLEGLGITPPPIEPKPQIVNQTPTSTVNAAPNTASDSSASDSKANVDVADSEVSDSSENSDVVEAAEAEDGVDDSTNIEEMDTE